MGLFKYGFRIFIFLLNFHESHTIFGMVTIVLVFLLITC